MMGFRFRKTLGTPHIKTNIGKKGYNSTSFKITKGVTYNSKIGITLGIPGTGISYNFGKGKSRKASNSKNLHIVEAYNEEMKEISEKRINDQKIKTEKRQEHNKKFIECTGGYNRKIIIAIIISFILCLTPLWPLGLILLLFSLFFFIVDTVINIFKFNKYMKKASKNTF